LERYLDWVDPKANPPCADSLRATNATQSGQHAPERFDNPKVAGFRETTNRPVHHESAVSTAIGASARDGAQRPTPDHTEHFNSAPFEGTLGDGSDRMPPEADPTSHRVNGTPTSVARSAFGCQKRR